MICLPIAFLLALLFRFFHKTSASSRLWTARMVFRLPLIGNLCREIAAARFSRSFGMLLRGGVETTEAMKLSAKVVGNPYVEREIEAAADYVSAGRQISEALDATNIMPRDLILAVSLSEDRGAVSQDLLEVADNHDAAVESKLDSLIQVMEPALLVFMGLFVTLCALSAWLPYIWLIPTVGPKGVFG
jgi:type IV pilus assembly protein PilC